MKTMIFEPLTGGHMTNYLEALLSYASRHGATPKQLVVIMSPKEFSRPTWESQIAPVANCATVEPAISHVPYSPAFGVRNATSYLETLRTLMRAFEVAVARHKPDFVIVPSADLLSLALALYGGRSLENLDSTAVFHRGFAGSAESLGDRVKDALNRWAWKRSKWSRMMTVNPIVAEAAQRQSLALELCPDPVPDLVKMDRNQACELLGLDPESRYVAFVGAVRERAALTTLIDGFALSELPASFKLLIAGKVNSPLHRAFIEQSKSVEMLGDRFVHIDRYLSFPELSAAWQVADIAAPFYRRSHALSGNLLKGIKSGKPMLLADGGYSQWMASRFSIGRCCSTSDPRAVAATLPELLQDARQMPKGDKSFEMLMKFHDPDNFAATLFGDALPNCMQTTSWPLTKAL